VSNWSKIGVICRTKTRVFWCLLTRVIRSENSSNATRAIGGGNSCKRTHAFVGENSCKSTH
jgi:hypothetical protein